MNIFVNAYARAFQGIMWVACHLFDFSEPKVISGGNKLAEIPELLKQNNKKSVLVVTDEGIWKIGLIKPLLAALDKAKFPYQVFHGVVANPTVDNVEEGYKIYKENNCDSLVAVGGGSAMDCCKTIAARAVKPNTPVNKMKGLMKVGKKPAFMVAVPTTAGTGSETTVAAVIVDKAKDDKYAINDPKLIPPYAVLDPTLLTGLPKHISSTTGMDALTHAVEAFIGHSNTKKTYRYGIEATQIIFKYLEKSVENPTNIEYREQMQIASYKAGVAFTRAYVGTVHAVAHSLGGKYNVPHGLANAVILPKMLKLYGKKAHKKLAILADAVGIGTGNSDAVKARMFIEEIEAMNKRMGITNTFGKLIEDMDIPFLVNHAYKETVPLYPVPRILSKKELTELYKELQQEK